MFEMAWKSGSEFSLNSFFKLGDNFEFRLRC